MASARLPPECDPLEHAEALIRKGRADEAADFLKKLVEQGRGGLLARLTYTRALIAAAKIERALETARETAQLFPDIAVVALALGEALLTAGKLVTAISEFQRALRIDPGLMPARYLLGCAWLEAGEAEKALREFQAVEADDAHNDVLQKIAEATAILAQPRANARYVRHLFDQFSGSYDARMLEQLHYAAPDILRKLFNLVGPNAAKRSLAILDLGCGTGLSGAAFKDLAHRLEGIDLSPAMVEQARAREIYDDLSVGDIESVQARDGSCDLVIAADTLVYLGDLSRVFETAQRVLKPDGHFLFTVEKGLGTGYDLGPKRRWRHSEAYLRAEADRSGFIVAGLMACAPRMEAGAPVEGLAAALQRGGR